MTDFGLPALYVLGKHIYRNTARKTGRQTDRQTDIVLQKSSRQSCKTNCLLLQNRHAIVNQLRAMWFGWLFILQPNVNCWNSCKPVMIASAWKTHKKITIGLFIDDTVKRWTIQGVSKMFQQTSKVSYLRHKKGEVMIASG